MKKSRLYTCFLFLIVVNITSAQYTLIPDAEFEQRLITQGIDTEGTLDGQVLTDDIDHITVLDLTTQFPEIFPTISDLTGIEDFISLEFLNFASNTVEQVDLSSLTSLKTLVCKYNNLTSIDVSNNILLEGIDLINCFPGACDQENTFTEIDLSNNVNLESFFSSHNYFYELDFSNNPLLDRLRVSYSNTITTLNIKNENNLNLDIFNALENPNLTCITVDDPIAATNGDTPPYDAWNVQESIVFSEDCSLGIEEILIENISLYPNPTSTFIAINNSSSYPIETLKIYDILGRLVLQEKEPFNTIDVSHLSNGLLFVKLETEQGSIVKKLMKE